MYKINLRAGVLVLDSVPVSEGVHHGVKIYSTLEPHPSFGSAGAQWYEDDSYSIDPKRIITIAQEHIRASLNGALNELQRYYNNLQNLKALMESVS